MQVLTVYAGHSRGRVVAFGDRSAFLPGLLLMVRRNAGSRVCAPQLGEADGATSRHFWGAASGKNCRQSNPSHIKSPSQIAGIMRVINRGIKNFTGRSADTLRTTLWGQAVPVDCPQPPC